MLKTQGWFNYADDLNLELLQAADEGKDIDGFEEKVKSIQSMESGDPKKELQAAAILDEIAALPIKSDYKYIEPSEISEIKSARPDWGKNIKLDVSGLSDEKLFDKVYGAWLGRCTGCLLGQPIECWYRDRIVGLLKETGNYPIRYYISSDITDELRKKYEVIDEAKVYGGSLKNWINNVIYMPEDDDTNYTIIGLKTLEQYGPGFTPDDMAESWLANLPILHVCTAERVAYKNLVNKTYPPNSATFRNIYREWIGAQIRADLFGYSTPGNPSIGAEMAWRDASISHVKNGIYGEMFVAAMLSAAAVVNDVEKIIEYGLSQIPEKSRLTEAIRKVLTWKKVGLDWEQAIDKIHQIYNEKVQYDWCHTITNAIIVCMALIYGELDFERSIGIAVVSAFDTDCNGATVGSIVGMIIGAKALPQKWIRPLNDQVKSGVDGFGLEKISDMARRTLDVAKKVSEFNQSK